MRVWFILLLLSMYSCTKEVKIDIPGYQNQLVVDGIIETGGNPIVIPTRRRKYLPTSFRPLSLERLVSIPPPPLLHTPHPFPRASRPRSHYPSPVTKICTDAIRNEKRRMRRARERSSRGTAIAPPPSSSGGGSSPVENSCAPNESTGLSSGGGGEEGKAATPALKSHRCSHSARHPSSSWPSVGRPSSPPSWAEGHRSQGGIVLPPT